MPREVELDSGGEDAHLAAGGVVDEHGLAEPEIARHLLAPSAGICSPSRKIASGLPPLPSSGRTPGAGEAWARPKTTGVAPDRVPPMAGDIELRAGEESVYQGHPSWRALASFYLLGLLVGLALLLLLWFAFDETALAIAVGLGVAAVVVLVGYLRRVSTKYVITNQRLRISRGIVSRKVQETRLDRVQNVNFDQSVFDRMLSVGTVDFDTAGTDDSEFRFEWVNDPEGVVKPSTTPSTSSPAPALEARHPHRCLHHGGARRRRGGGPRARAVFPVEGHADFGEADARFGAPRGGTLTRVRTCSRRREPRSARRARGSWWRRATAGAAATSRSGTPGRRTFVYLHMLRPTPWRRGERVEAGSRIGAVGCTGSCWETTCTSRYDAGAAPPDRR